MSSRRPYPVPTRPAPGRPVRRRSGCGVVAVVLGVVLGLGVALLGLMASVVGSAGGSTTAGPRPTVSSAPAPTTSPEPGPTEDTAEERREQARRVVREHPIYSERVPDRRRCADVDPARLGAGDRQRWADTTVGDCLLPMYARAFRDATGEALTPPGVEVVAGEEVSTPCGTNRYTDNEAFYCNGSQTIYLWSLNLADDPRGIAAGHLVLGHEFGHHVQLAAGITSARRYLGDVEDAGTEMTRRSELQVECMAGQFLRAVGPDQSGFERNRFPDSVVVGGSETHGSNESVVRWLGRGYRDTRIGVCNTFSAAADEVR